MLERYEVALTIAPDDTDAPGSATMRVVPYGVPIMHGGIQQQYDAGSIEVPDSVPLTIDHGEGVLDRIGVVSRSAGGDDGLYAAATFADTQLGRETRELLKLGAVTGVSAEIWVDTEKSVKDDAGVYHLQGRLSAVSVVPSGAFGEAGSKVLAVHSKEGASMPEENEAPAVEPKVEVDYATASEVETLRTMVAELSVPGGVNARPTEYKSLGEVFVDVNKHGRGGDADATQRLTSLIDGGVINPNGTIMSLGLESYAFSGIGGSVGGGVAYDAYIPDLLTLLRNGRPTAELLQKRQLPTEGNKVFMPAVSQGGIVGYQDGQGVQLANQEQLQILTDTPKTTIGGGQGVTVQAQLWTNPGYMEAVASDLTEAYGEFQNEKVVNGDRSVDTPGSATGYEGIMEIAGTTDVPVGGAPLGMIPLLGDAWAAVWAGTKRAPSHALMSAAMWGALLNEVDTDGRPIIQNIGVVNPVGTGDAGSVAGTLRGLTVVIDDAVGDTDVIVTNFRDSLLFEDSGSPAQLRLTYPDVLVTDISIFGFSALFIRRPAAYAILSGITIP